MGDDNVAMGRHLEPGCVMLTFAKVALADMPDHDLSAWNHVAGR